jgi:thiopurine S-methyltransferase
MDPDFWRARWGENKIAFHQSSPSPLLVAYVDRVAPDPRTSVFVPLCGKSKDLAYLAARGHEVVGIELVESALAAFHEENGIPYAMRREGDLAVFEAERITTYGGDFFRLQPSSTGAFDWIFDRGALVAWSERDAPRYVEHLVKFLRAGGRMLLISLDYDQREMTGPPFSVPPARVGELFGRIGSIELLGERDALEERFRARGCTRCTERAWLFTKAT